MLAVTYTRRHRTLQDVSKRSLPSSPLEDLSPTRDLTLSEMSRRMKKRTRLVLSESHDNMIQKHPMEPFFKKSKTSGSQRDRSVETLILPSTPITLERPLLPLATQQIYDSIFETPESSADTAIKASEIPDQLSPIPLARRMLSRTSSRNFKENSGKNSRTGLASPFNSRPTSRASSPLRIANSNRRPISHVKARTLSTNLPRLKDVTASIGPLSTDAEKDSILASSVAVSAPMSASHTLHSRAASIPAMNSALFNSITLENWLVPPKVLSRSPTVSPDDLQLDTFQVEHASFYFDVPTKVSTPPRKRSTTITQRSFRNREDSEGFEMSQPNKDDDVAMSDDGIVPQQSRRRRRTVVHMSSDSIFSSALDFSAYTSDDYQTARREVPVVDPTDILDSASNVHNAGSILDSAFSPASTRKGASQFVPVEEICSTAPSSPESAPRKALPSSVVLPTSHLHHLLSRRSQSLPIKPDADTNELNDMFTMLGLEEQPKPDIPSEDAHLAVSSGQPVQDEVIGLGRSTEHIHKRRRGDTIRASDFSRPSVSFESRSVAGSSSSTVRPEVAPGARRVRSGTVTVASVQSHPIEVLITDRNRKTHANVRTRGRMQNVSRRPPGPATIIMKIDDEPLPPQGSDEEDDELLLTGQIWNDFDDN